MRPTSTAIAILLSLAGTHSFARSSDLCAQDQRIPPFTKYDNEKRETIDNILRLRTSKIKKVVGTPKTLDPVAQARARAVLAFKPKFISSTPLWSESVMLSKKGLIVNLHQSNEKILRMEIEGDYACIQDRHGRYWYFRMGSEDGWPEKE